MNILNFSITSMHFFTSYIFVIPSEKEILNLENKLSNLNNKLYEEDIYLDKDKYQSVLKEIEEVKIIIKNKEDMWDNLTKEIE